ncbi:hypothetical protein P7K49_002149 [Saguinus oedipus]|uniref:Uncharacterized protein n=1 Tax=Saguinus oedipus TaxID=9490 RepID=A0ABQ9WGH3_SAGOE|nr:hypothetical protein P7K49_002149 [Saguinus oedipus]
MQPELPGSAERPTVSRGRASCASPAPAVAAPHPNSAGPSGSRPGEASAGLRTAGTGRPWPGGRDICPICAASFCVSLGVTPAVPALPAAAPSPSPQHSAQRGCGLGQLRVPALAQGLPQACSVLTGPGGRARGFAPKQVLPHRFLLSPGPGPAWLPRLPAPHSRQLVPSQARPGIGAVLSAGPSEPVAPPAPRQVSCLHRGAPCRVGGKGEGGLQTREPGAGAEPPAVGVARCGRG